MQSITNLSAPTDDFFEVGGALEYLFSSFVSRHLLHVGKHDKEFRKPEVLMDLAKSLNLSPSASHTCLVTGSKGKGSVARMIAWNLSAAGFKVGLVLSPEECLHLDRIRIDNKPIPDADFCRILSLLRPKLDALLIEQAFDFYLPPTGMFLLIALHWYKEQGVNAWVIEGGRGVEFDEIGQIDARVGVITNVMPEHLIRLGPNLDAIVQNKLSLANRCEKLAVGASMRSWISTSAKVHAPILFEPERFNADRPAWFEELNAIACLAARQIMPNIAWQKFSTPAFFFAKGGIQAGKILPGSICCDAAIHPNCLDIDFLKSSGLAKGAAVIGLSRDKDGEGVLLKLSEAGFNPIVTVGLSSRINHISAWQAMNPEIEQIIAIDVIDVAPTNLAEILRTLAEKHQSVYVIGVQLFMRSVRQGLSIGLLAPDAV